MNSIRRVVFCKKQGIFTKRVGVVGENFGI